MKFFIILLDHYINIITEACEKFYALLQTITAKINIRQMHHITKSPKLVSVNKRYLKVRVLGVNVLFVNNRIVS